MQSQNFHLLVGKKTPVWYNKELDEVVIGSTIQDALGVGISYEPKGWERATKLPRGKRVVIDHSSPLSCNTFTQQIAENAYHLESCKLTFLTTEPQL